MRILTILFYLLFICSAWGNSLQFFLADKLVKSLSLEEMKKISKTKDIKLHYNFSKSSVKRYRALELAPIIKAIYKESLENGTYSEFVLEALDGYKSYSSLETLLKEGGYIAFQDLDVKSGWEPVGREMASPAPYFLVWEGREQTTANEFPWPWALARVYLVEFQQRYPKVYPKGEKKNSAEYKGYEIFKGLCFRCHAIDRQGGQIGPDLAAPKNIVEYRTEKFLRQFIREPGKISLFQNARS